jgi:hypothetical protein
MTVTRFTQDGIDVKSIAVPDVEATDVALEMLGALDQVVPLVVNNTLPAVVGATKVGVDVPAPIITEPEVKVVAPVPPLATFNVPANVTAPVVAVEGVNPVVPAVKDETDAAAAEATLDI